QPEPALGLLAQRRRAADQALELGADLLLHLTEDQPTREREDRPIAAAALLTAPRLDRAVVQPRHGAAATAHLLLDAAADPLEHRRHVEQVVRPRGPELRGEPREVGGDHDAVGPEQAGP